MRHEGIIHCKGVYAVTIQDNDGKQFYCYLIELSHLNIYDIIQNKTPITFNVDKKYIYGFNHGSARYLAYNVKIKKDFFTIENNLKIIQHSIRYFV